MFPLPSRAAFRDGEDLNESFVETFFEVLEEIRVKRIATLAAIAGAAAVVIAPVPASAESAELRITGTIVPAACTPAFAGGGVVDYGTIPASSLNPTAQTTLAEKSIQLTMTCDAPVRFGFKVIDERAASAVTSLETIQGATPNMKFGLGTSDGKNIGAYSLQVVRETVNGGGFSIALESGDGGISWGSSTKGACGVMGANLFHSATPRQISRVPTRLSRPISV
ncbi:DUF1120 domain-containing protein [Variovorax boronicumulans]|uniref:DUF1120 domain-containing protein n=1 Tax=Variovorax boronicumulans TaxID=436515 RepID=UPI0036F246C2